ncbi:hypothetical protein [Streptomyces sp. enrichment culture]|uniref:hypothetical protein n=1 Tax=Streptomyces sp. enrichment culture TaxID=1795815 RepID=UPI003F572D2B
MNTDRLTAEVVFDRSLVEDPGGATLVRVARVLAETAPAWASEVVVWSPEPGERSPLGPLAALPDVVRDRTRWATEDRHSGNVELRGATGDLNVVVSVNSSPLARVGGRLLLNNGVTVAALREEAAGAARAAFERICDEARPVWGAVYRASVYRAQVMADGPVLRAVGRDFSRFLPGLFEVNYFGAKYVELIGEATFERLGTAARKAGDGWIVEATGAADLLSRIGTEYFFLKGTEGRATRAPDW